MKFSVMGLRTVDAYWGNCPVIRSKVPSPFLHEKVRPEQAWVSLPSDLQLQYRQPKRLKNQWADKRILLYIIIY